MASLILRNLAKIVPKVPRTGVLAATRTYADSPYIEPHKGKIVDPSIESPDPLGHAVGNERFEMLAKLHGDDDPFELTTLTNVGGTKAEPTLVPSIYESRLVGCVCEEDSLAVQWMELHRGVPQRCMCGYWFKLTEVEYKDYGQ